MLTDSKLFGILLRGSSRRMFLSCPLMLIRANALLAQEPVGQLLRLLCAPSASAIAGQMKRPRIPRTGPHTYVRVRNMTDSKPRICACGGSRFSAVGAGPRKRSSASSKKPIFPAMSVSHVARLHGVAPNQLFGWRRQAESGALTATRAGGEVVLASEYRSCCRTRCVSCSACSAKDHGERDPARAVSRVVGPKTPLRMLSSPEGNQ